MDQQIIFQRLNALLASGRMSEMRGALLMLNPVDIAQYLSSLETENLLRVFRILPGDCSADVFSYMDDEQREKLVSSIGDKEAGHLVENMFVDDAVDFLEEMPAELVRRVLSNVNEEQRHIINRFLSYPDGSAGSIMTIEYCRLPLGTTVAEAMDDIRANGVDKETINTLYIVDANGVLRGTLPLRKLITADDETRVDDLMDVNFVSVQTHDDREKAAAFKRIKRFRRSAPRGDAHHRRRNHRFIHQNISFVRARSISAAHSDGYYTIKFVRCQPKNSIFN